MPPDATSRLRALLREPTVHFLAIALAVFALHALAGRRGAEVLEIGRGEIEARLQAREIADGRPLTEERRRAETAAYIDERILAREARALGLDEDARIRDLLAQKMLHVLSGEVIQPTEAELRAHYEAGRERYRTPATADLDELALDGREPLPAAVLAGLAEGAGAEELLALAPGSRSPLAGVSRAELAVFFDPELADAAFAADIGQWVGPFESGRGRHWLQLLALEPPRLPALEEIADRVRLDWIAAEEEARLAAETARLRERYRVVVVEDAGR